MSKGKQVIKTYNSIIESDVVYKIKIINRIFFEAKLSLDSCYANKWNNNRNAKVKIPSYMIFLSYLCFKNFIIELSKLIKQSKNEHFNLFDFIDLILENNSFFYCNVKEINDLYNRMRILQAEPSSVLNQILKLRDKIYAHTDEDFEIYDKFINHHFTDSIIGEISQIIDLLNKYLKLHKEITYRWEGNYSGFVEFYDDLYIKYNKEQGYD